MNRAATDAFEPFVPRRVGRAVPNAPEHVPEGATGTSEADREIDVAPQARARSHEPRPCDPDVCAAKVRDLAIRLAGAACARALREAIARNPLFVTRFVDDALRAAGEPADARARLHPDAAAACAGRVRCEVVADPALPMGAVEIHTDRGRLRATIEERALALARAAADA